MVQFKMMQLMVLKKKCKKYLRNEINLLQIEHFRSDGKIYLFRLFFLAFSKICTRRNKILLGEFFNFYSLIYINIYNSLSIS